MKKNVVVMLLMLMVIAGVFSGCGKKSGKETGLSPEIDKRGYVIIGLDDTFVPMGFKDDKGELVGFDVELAREVFKRAGIKVEFQQIDWSMKETELNSGNIDLIWNGYSITEERKEKVAITKPYIAGKQIIVTMANSTINGKKDLKGKKVATQAGSSSLDAINREPEVLKSLKDGKPVLFDTNDEAIMDLEAGRVDAVVADEVYARYYINKKGSDKYKVLDEDFGNDEVGVGVRKQDTKLFKLIENTLEEMKKDGTAGKISEKYFGKNIVK